MRALPVLVLWAMSIVSALGQVNADIVFEQDQFLRSESLPLRVRISNFSGQTLQLGTVAEWLVFTVQNRDGRALPTTAEIQLPDRFSIESSKSVSLRADLMPYFNISEPGRYTVTARLKVPQLEREVVTPSKTFDIISGTKIWEHEFGVPGQTPPEVRKYALQQAVFLKEPRLYLRVTDATEQKLFRVLSLGPVFSFTAIEPQFDKSSNLHVLFQNGRNTFQYSVVSPDGDQIIRQTYEQISSRPRLRTEADGRVVVSGGQRKTLASDLPPKKVARTNASSAVEVRSK